jgi:hypothetical protein
MSVREFIRESFMFVVDRVDWPKTILTCGVILVFCFTSYTLAYVDIPDHNRDGFNRFSGTIDAALMLILSYYFGSSKGSQKKDDIIKTQAESR